jgi:hypothetical protein
VSPVDSIVKDTLNKKLAELEAELSGDVLTMYGPIVDGNKWKSHGQANQYWAIGKGVKA